MTKSGVTGWRKRNRIWHSGIRHGIQEIEIDPGTRMTKSGVTGWRKRIRIWHSGIRHGIQVCGIPGSDTESRFVAFRDPTRNPGNRDRPWDRDDRMGGPVGGKGFEYVIPGLTRNPGLCHSGLRHGIQQCETDPGTGMTKSGPPGWWNTRPPRLVEKARVLGWWKRRGIHLEGKRSQECVIPGSDPESRKSR